jgi:hypothetical protein
MSAADMNLPGRRWHPLSGELQGHWAVWLDENWRLTFSFEGSDAVLVDYLDYHGRWKRSLDTFSRSRSRRQPAGAG